MFLLLVMLVYTAWAADEMLYPDLSCHKGYNNDTNKHEMGTAIGFVRDSMDYCNNKENRQPCFKSCAMMMSGIVVEELDSVGMELIDDEHMWHNIAYVHFKNNNDPTARSIAKKIVSSCADLAEKARDLPCAQRNDFFACVEKAWAC